MEPIAARKVFPGFDEPAFKVPFDLVLVTRADHVAITTTPEIAREPLDDGYVRRVFDTTRPMPTYLLAFAVGPYDLVDYGTIPANATRDRELPLRAIAARGLGDRLDYALENTDGILTVLEQYFGTPYPYKKLDLIAVPGGFGGAMENIGAITYNEFLLLMDENSPLHVVRQPGHAGMVERHLAERVIRELDHVQGRGRLLAGRRVRPRNPETRTRRNGQRLAGGCAPDP
jgi:alanyl aminopeptidase